MAHRGMKALRRIGMPIMVVLVILMLATLGISPSMKCGARDDGDTVGTFVLAGETVEITQGDVWANASFLSLVNHVLGEPPPWKFATDVFGRVDPRFENYQAETEDLWTFIVLDRVAERLGVPVSMDLAGEWIRRSFTDRERVYDREKYLAFMARPQVSALWATPKDFERMVAKYLRVKYLVSLYDSLMDPGSERVYETWKARNKRHDIRYSVQEVGTLRAAIDPAAFSAEEVRQYYEDSEIKRKFLIPTQRSFEAAYVVPAELGDEAVAALAAKAAEMGLAAVSPDEAKQYYYANQKDYPLDPIRDRLKKEWEERKKAREGSKETEGAAPGGAPPEEAAAPAGAGGAPEGGENPAGGASAADPAAAGAAGDPPPAGADPAPIPAAEDVPFDDPQDLEFWARYEKFFRAQVERELLVSKMVSRALGDERIDQKGLEAVAKAGNFYYFRTETPLDQYAVAELPKFGSGALRDALNSFKAGAEPGYCEEPVVAGASETRTYTIFKVLEVVGEHFPAPADAVAPQRLRTLVAGTIREAPSALADLSPRDLLAKAFPDATIPEKDAYSVEDVVRLMLRQSRAEKQATERLETIREIVIQSNQAFEAAAAEKGLTVRVLKGLSSDMTIPADYVAAEGATLTPDQVRVNRERAERRFIVHGSVPGKGGVLSLIDRTEPEKFVESVLTDKDTDAAYLVMVTAHRTPGPEEMPEVRAQSIRFEMFQSQQRRAMQAFFDFTTLAQRYRLEVPGLTDREPSADR